VDLRTGLGDEDIVACKNITNLVQAEGENITCKLLTAPSIGVGNNTTVRITNFNPIFSNVQVTLHIADIANPDTPEIDTYVTINTYSIRSRVY